MSFETKIPGWSWQWMNYRKKLFFFQKQLNAILKFCLSNFHAAASPTDTIMARYSGVGTRCKNSCEKKKENNPTSDCLGNFQR